MQDENRLAELRAQIDEVDEKIVALVNERARLALLAGIAKGSREIRRPERETEVLKRISKMSKGPLSDEGIREIFRTIIGICRAIQYNK